MSDWSDFGQEVEAVDGGRGPRCAIRVLLDKLPEADARQVEKVLNNPAVSHVAIEKAFRSRLGDKAPSEWSIGNHRRDKCRCTG